MQLNDYVPLATVTESTINEVQFDRDQYNLLMTIAISVGDLMDQVKKNVFYGKPIDQRLWQHTLEVVSGSCYTLKYKDAIKWTANEDPQPLEVNTRLFHSAIGIFTEASELLDCLTSKNSDAVNFREEIGDVEWYQAIAYDELNVDAQANLQNNIDKLQARYPAKFEAHRAINRDLNTERKILEGTHGGATCVSQEQKQKS